MFDTVIAGEALRNEDHPRNPNTAITTAAPATTATLLLERGCTAGTGIVPVSVSPPLGVAASPSRCGSISSAVCHRSAGRLARHFITS